MFTLIVTSKVLIVLYCLSWHNQLAKVRRNRRTPFSIRQTHPNSINPEQAGTPVKEHKV